MKNLLPIRKVAAGLVASLLVAGLRLAGLSVGDADVDSYANAFVGFVVAYLIPDPRVQKLVHKLSLREKYALLKRAIARQYELEQPSQGVPVPPAPVGSVPIIIPADIPDVPLEPAQSGVQNV
jgi:hypothetical protein